MIRHEKLGEEIIVGLLKNDLLSRQWIETFSSDWQQEWCGIGDVEQNLDKKGGVCEVQRSCAMNSIMKMKESKIRSTLNECRIENTVLCLLNLDNLEGIVDANI